MVLVMIIITESWASSSHSASCHQTSPSSPCPSLSGLSQWPYNWSLALEVVGLLLSPIPLCVDNMPPYLQSWPSSHHLMGPTAPLSPSPLSYTHFLWHLPHSACHGGVWTPVLDSHWARSPECRFQAIFTGSCSASGRSPYACKCS